MDVAFISGDGVRDNMFIDVAADAAEGVYATGPIDTSANPIAQAARQAHQQRFGKDPGPFFMNGYAAVLSVVNAIERDTIKLGG